LFQRLRELFFKTIFDIVDNRSIFLTHQKTNANPDTTAIVFAILPETINAMNLANFIFFAPAEIKMKSPITGSHDAKNIAPHPNLLSSLLPFFSLVNSFLN